MKESALKALKDAGFGSAEAVRQAEDKALLAVEGIDAKVLSVLRENPYREVAFDPRLTPVNSEVGVGRDSRDLAGVASQKPDR